MRLRIPTFVAKGPTSEHLGKALAADLTRNNSYLSREADGLLQRVEMGTIKMTISL